LYPVFGYTDFICIPDILQIAEFQINNRWLLCGCLPTGGRHVRKRWHKPRRNVNCCSHRPTGTWHKFTWIPRCNPLPQQLDDAFEVFAGIEERSFMRFLPP